MAELKAELRAMSPREWWVWVIQHRGLPAERRYRWRTIMAKWPYVRPVEDPAWGALWPTTVLDFGTARNALVSFVEENFPPGEQRQNAIDHIRNGSGYPATGQDMSLGSMFCVEMETVGRGGLYRFLFTPPVYEFCNLETEFLSINAEVTPHDFWIQPEVYEATGEILQGSPIDPANTDGYINGLRRGVSIQTFDSPDHQQYLDYVRIALDAFLQQGVPDNRFLVTFAEKCERDQKAWESRCHFKSVDEATGMQVKVCDEVPTCMVRLPSMQSGDPMCREHADTMAHDGYVFDVIKKNPPRKRNPHHDVNPELCGWVMRRIVEIGGRHESTSFFTLNELGMELASARVACRSTTPGGNTTTIGGTVRTWRDVVVECVAYFVDRDFLTKDGMSYALSPKALNYDDRNVSRWPERHAVAADAALLQTMHSAELSRYVRSFMDDPGAWWWESHKQTTMHGHATGVHAVGVRVEVGTDASEYSIVIELEPRRDAPWPQINIRPVANRYPIQKPEGDPQADAISNRSFPYSPQQFAAMVVPFMDRFHP